MLIKDKIFEYFGVSYKQKDTYKDNQGRGILERINRTIGHDIDENIIPLIDSLLSNIYVPNTLLDKLIPHLEESLGITLYLGEDLRRKVIENIFKFYQVKGTVKGYEVCFYLLGYIATLIIGNNETDTFDDGGVFDDGGTFDISTSGMLCKSCINYSIELTGTTVVTQEVYNAVYSIVTFNEPINARLTGITLNGEPFEIPVGDYDNSFNSDFF